MPGKVSKQYKSRVVKIHQDFYPKETILLKEEIISPEIIQDVILSPEISPETEIIQDIPKSSFNKYFDKIFVINLDRRPDRWEKCQEELKKHNIVAERFSAIDGETLNKEHFKPNCILSKGEIGCCMSHAAVIKLAQSYNYSKILILEDDVTFSENAGVIFQQNINNIPNNWQMLYLGGNHLVEPITIYPRAKLARIKRTYTTSSYAVRNVDRFLPALIASLEQFKEPADVCYCKFQMGCFCYSFYPGICFQTPGYSDIVGGFTDYFGIIR